MKPTDNQRRAMAALSKHPLVKEVDWEKQYGIEELLFTVVLKDGYNWDECHMIMGPDLDFASDLARVMPCKDTCHCKS